MVLRATGPPLHPCHTPVLNPRALGSGRARDNRLVGAFEVVQGAGRGRSYPARLDKEPLPWLTAHLGLCAVVTQKRF
jgi:hypothetical protein